MKFQKRSGPDAGTGMRRGAVTIRSGGPVATFRECRRRGAPLCGPFGRIARDPVLNRPYLAARKAPLVFEIAVARLAGSQGGMKRAPRYDGDLSRMLLYILICELMGTARAAGMMARGADRNTIGATSCVKVGARLKRQAKVDCV